MCCGLLNYRARSAKPRIEVLRRVCQHVGALSKSGKE